MICNPHLTCAQLRCATCYLRGCGWVLSASALLIMDCSCLLSWHDGATHIPDWELRRWCMSYMWCFGCDDADSIRLGVVRTCLWRVFDSCVVVWLFYDIFVMHLWYFTYAIYGDFIICLVRSWGVGYMDFYMISFKTTFWFLDLSFRLLDLEIFFFFWKGLLRLCCVDEFEVLYGLIGGLWGWEWLWDWDRYGDWDCG